MDNDNTQGAAEPSPASAGSQPVAWAALNDDGDIAWIGYTEEGAADGSSGRAIVPLYRSPTLTDEEREVLESLVFVARLYAPERTAGVIQRLLERLGKAKE